jgi:hypothetical protein
MSWTAAVWQTNIFRYERYRTLAIHDTNDPDTIIVEQEAFGTSTSTGEFALPNVVVLTVRNGQIAHLRDYVNILAAAAARVSTSSEYFRGGVGWRPARS